MFTRTKQAYRTALANAEPRFDVSDKYRAAQSDGNSKESLLSALQKEIRRGKATSAARAMLHLLEIGKAPRGVGIATNAFNRCIVILFEDVAPPSPRLIKKFCDLYGACITANTERQLERAAVELVYFLARAKKLRLLSHAKARFYSDSVREWAKDDERFGTMFAEDPPRRDEPTDAKERALELQRLSDLLDQRKIEEAHRQAAWILSFAHGTADTKRDRDPLTMLYSACHGTLKLERRRALEKLELLAWHFFNHRDRLVFAIAPILLCGMEVLNDELPLAPTAEEIDSVLAAHKSSAYAMPDYALDLHTPEGRRMGRGAVHFAQVGAVVNNQLSQLARPEWHALYDAYKAHSESGKRKRKEKPKSNKKAKI